MSENNNPHEVEISKGYIKNPKKVFLFPENRNGKRAMKGNMIMKARKLALCDMNIVPRNNEARKTLLKPT